MDKQDKIIGIQEIEQKLELIINGLEQNVQELKKII